MSAPLLRALYMPAEPDIAPHAEPRAIHVAAVLLVAIALFTWPVPSGNEFVYLLTPYRFSHPDFLARDWTFAGNGGEHFLFNTVVGAIMRVVPLEIVGWIGRAVSWVLIGWGLLRLGTRAGLTAWASTLAVAIWLAYGQSLVGGEWLIRGFEAKTASYVALVLALHLLLDGRALFAGILLGLCFSLHPSVGAAAGLAAVVAAFRLPYDRRDLALLFGGAALGGLPGLAASIPMLLHPADGAAGVWEFLVRSRMPWHLDTRFFVKADVFALFAAFAFNMVHAWVRREDRVLRFLADFQVVLAIIFVAGWIAYAMGAYAALQVMPFRLMPVFVLLFFFFQLFRAAADVIRPHTETPRARTALGLLAIGTLLVMPNPVVRALNLLQQEVDGWRQPDPLAGALAWVGANTPQDALVILPPWRRDAFYRARRATVANWTYPSIERPAEWRARIEELVGPIDPAEGLLTDAQLERRYDAMDPARLHALAAKYDATWLVARTAYDLPVAYRSGDYKVYRLR